MANDNNIAFQIPKTGYLAFDATTIQSYVKDRLNEVKTYTDQNYSGSYLTTVTEIISFFFGMLMYNLNRTSTESLFSEAQLYENMNRIVKLLDYKPIGKQTSTCTFILKALAALPYNTTYTLPRYSYIDNGKTSYAFKTDLSFTKEIYNEDEIYETLSREQLLYQGRYDETPVYVATGNDNEILFFAPGENILIDHFSIDVYVKDANTNKWRQWKNVPTLYLENALSESFELRLNENKKYEIKFGNNINGKKLNENDQVVIFYIKSNGVDGYVGENALQNKKIKLYSSTVYDQILSDLNETSNYQYNYMDNDNITYISLSESGISTYYTTEESVASIKENAPGVFRSQYRLVTLTDYENYVRTNFANLIHDVKAINNAEYLSTQLKYYYEEIGLTNPANISNISYNQVLFADACNFNNIYLVVIPKTITGTQVPRLTLTPTQKNLIISSMKDIKVTTSEVVFLDPVFIGVDICIPVTSNTTATLDDVDKTILVIERENNSRRDPNSLKLEVAKVFEDYFSRDNMRLGKLLDLTTLTSQILAVNGVKTFYVSRTDNANVKYKGLSMLMWNPVYPVDLQLTSENKPIENFKFLYFNDIENFINKIVVSSELTVYENIEF